MIRSSPAPAAPRGRAAVLVLGLLLGCPPDDDSKDDTGDDDVWDDDAGDDDISVGPCSGGTWGGIGDPEHALHVRVDGSDDGDGSLGAPFRTVPRAVEVSREAGQPKAIAIGPGGKWVEPVSITAADDGLVIEGCSHEQSEIGAVTVDGVEGFRLADLRTGGGSTLAIANSTSVQLQRVTVPYALHAGISVEDSDAVTLDEVRVRSIEQGSLANCQQWGNWATGVRLVGSTVDVTALDVHDGQGSGLVAVDSTLALTGASIGDIMAAGSGIGRGIHLEDCASVILDDVTIAGDLPGVEDAGIFSMGCGELTVTDCVVQDAVGVTLPLGGTSGDGIVATPGPAPLDPTAYVVVLEDNEITEVARAGILLDGVSASLSGNTTDAEFYSQNGAAVSGTDQVTTLQTPLEWNPESYVP